MFHICVTNHHKIPQILKLRFFHLKRHKIETIVYDISLIRHFAALTLLWHSPQARRALNPWVLQ
jgi:hypothetical protein